MSTLKAHNKSDTSLLLDDLHCLYPVNNPLFLEGVIKSIEELGLVNPVVVERMSVAELRKLCFTTPSLLPPDGTLGSDQWVWVVRCGNNRVRAAQSLSYDSIDCLLVYSAQEASKVCAAQRGQM